MQDCEPGHSTDILLVKLSYSKAEGEGVILFLTSIVLPSYASVHFPPIKPWLLINPELLRRAVTLGASVLICNYGKWIQIPKTSDKLLMS